MRGVAASLTLPLLLAACLEPGPFEPPPIAAADPDALIAEGTRLLRLGEPDQAYDRFIRAFSAGGPPAQTLTGAGLALEAQGLLHQARDLLERASQLAPASVNTQNNLGVVEYKLGDYAAARNAFRQAFAVSSGGSAVALANLRAAERALEARAPRPDPQVTHRVQRLGGGVYRLGPSEEAPAPIPVLAAEETVSPAPEAAASQSEPDATPDAPAPEPEIAAAAPAEPVEEAPLRPVPSEPTPLAPAAPPPDPLPAPETQLVTPDMPSQTAAGPASAPAFPVLAAAPGASTSEP